MTSWSPEPVGLGTEEVRLATTMTGGVSLAVWMGGVTRELDLVQQAARMRRAAGRPDGARPPVAPDDLTAAERRERDLYGRLLDLLDSVVDTDVLSGTSAGGINAVLLALARVRERDLGPLRETWLDLGALLDLLRTPSDADVPSLLYGDRKMLAGLHDTLARLTARPVTWDAVSTTLYVTTTLLTPESGRFVDDLGTSVQDADHRGLFTFTEHHLARPDAADLLAVAARSTASYPAAFEPSYVPALEPLPGTPPVPVRPAMEPFANVTRGHWAADGGLLDNQPLDVLLQRVFDRPAKRRVRRLLLFVVPTTGPAPSALAAAPSDDPAAPYGLLEGLLHDLTAMTSQSVSASLRAIADHDDRARARLDLRRALARTAARLWPWRLLDDDLDLVRGFVARDAERVARPLVAAAMRLLSTWAPQSAATPVGIPARWAPRLLAGNAVAADFAAALRAGLADAAGPPAVPTAITALPAFGRGALDEAKSVVVTLARDAYDAAADDEQRERLTALLARVHGATSALRVRLDALPPGALLATGATGANGANAAAGRVGAADAADADDPDGARQRLDPADEVRAVLEQVVTTAPDASLEDAAHAVAARWTARTAVAVSSWTALGQALVDGADDLAAGDAAAGDADADGRRALLVALGLRAPRAGGGQGPVGGVMLDPAQPARPDAHAVALRLFDLVAAEGALLPAEAGPLQRVGLVQVSADTRTLLAPGRATAAAKLTGLQLSHFGAFYKRSWRANDWMWGRLDGAGWLVHALLSPARLAVVAEREATRAGYASRSAWVLDRLAELAGVPLADVPADQGGPSRAAVEAELAFLDDGTPAPTHLTRTSMWLATAWQHEVVLDELPRLAREVTGAGPDPGDAAQRQAVDRSPGTSREWAERVLAAAPEDLDALLDACPVADETFASDRGTPLMVRTLTKAAATTVAAVDSVPGVPGPARPALTTARTVSLAGFRVANATKAVPRVLVLVGLALVVLGVAFSTVSSEIVGVSALGVALAGAYVLTIGAWQASRRLVGAIVSLTLAAAVAALATPWARRLLFTGGSDGHGWLGDRADDLTAWLGSTWWHPLVAVAVVVVAGCVLAAVLSASRPGRSRRPRERPAQQG